MSPESVNRERRIKWVDLARSVAITCVVLCHAIEHTYQLTPQALTTMSDSSKLIALTGFSIGRLGVPLFLFITGYLLLDRQYDSKKMHYLLEAEVASLARMFGSVDSHLQRISSVSRIHHPAPGPNQADALPGKR